MTDANAESDYTPYTILTIFVVTSLIVFFAFSSSYSQVLEEDVLLEEIDLITKMPYTTKEYFYYKKKVFKVYHYIDTIQNIICGISTQENLHLRSLQNG